MLCGGGTTISDNYTWAVEPGGAGGVDRGGPSCMGVI